MTHKYSNAIIFSFLLLICLVKSVSAITADQIFKNFKKSYDTSKNFSANFEETTYREDTKSVAKGKLIFAKPNLLYKKYIDRNDSKRLVQLIVIDGKISWSYVPLLNQVTKLKLKDKNKQLIPGIGGTLEELKKTYNMKLIEDKVAKSKGVYHIELSPKDQAKPNSDPKKQLTESIEVWIRSKDWIPVQFSYKSESKVAGDMTIVISFRKIKIDQKLPKSTFVFEVPKGAEVIDISDENSSQQK